MKKSHERAFSIRQCTPEECHRNAEIARILICDHCGLVDRPSQNDIHGNQYCCAADCDNTNDGSEFDQSIGYLTICSPGFHTSPSPNNAALLQFLVIYLLQSLTVLCSL